jgi:16S rRNA (guanine527-N7)-methyltransferase
MKGDVRDFDAKADRSIIERICGQLSKAPLGDDALDGLARYLAQVVAWNRKLDLTAARGASAQAEVMLGDAFVLADLELCPEGARIVDVGTGAGAPIVPLLLLRPDVQAVCVEPLHKRVAFLRTVGARLGLVERMHVLERRVERGDALQGAPFEVACSRATLAPERWLPVGLSLARRVWVLLASDEPPAAPAGAELVSLQRYALPLSGAPRAVAVYDAQR